MGMGTAKPGGLQMRHDACLRFLTSHEGKGPQGMLGKAVMFQTSKLGQGHGLELYPRNDRRVVHPPASHPIQSK